MEENRKLEKKYTLTFEIMREGYDMFQKKNIYPKSYFFMSIFLALAVIYIVAAVKDPKSILAYILLFVCLALGFREWYNPRKRRRSFIDASREMGDCEYNLVITDTDIKITSVGEEPEENDVDENGEDEDSDIDDYEEPAPTEIPLDDNIYAEEYERFFLLYYDKRVFYIIPKNGWSEEELQIFRDSVPPKK